MKILMVIIMIIFYAFVIWPSREVTVIEKRITCVHLKPFQRMTVIIPVI